LHRHRFDAVAVTAANQQPVDLRFAFLPGRTRLFRRRQPVCVGIDDEFQKPGRGDRSDPDLLPGKP